MWLNILQLLIAIARFMKFRNGNMSNHSNSVWFIMSFAVCYSFQVEWPSDLFCLIIPQSIVELSYFEPAFHPYIECMTNTLKSVSEANRCHLICLLLFRLNILCVSEDVCCNAPMPLYPNNVNCTCDAWTILATPPFSAWAYRYQGDFIQPKLDIYEQQPPFIYNMFYSNVELRAEQKFAVIYPMIPLKYSRYVSYILFILFCVAILGAKFVACTAGHRNSYNGKLTKRIEFKLLNALQNCVCYDQNKINVW